MLARLYRPQDAAGLDLMLDYNRQGDTRVHRDLIVVAGPPGAPTGVLVATPVFYIHEFECGHSLGQMRIAEALVNFAVGHMSAVGLQHALFHVAPRNTAMQRYVERRGAVQNEGLIFKLTL